MINGYRSSVHGETISSPQTPDQATAARNALIKNIYGRAFHWLVKRINEALAVSGASRGRSTSAICALDIFGFEIFENNSFEQICINYANEKLQQQFNESTFKSEEATYTAERIEFTPAEFEDNADVLAMLERRPRGIFVLLDEECFLPRGSETSFAAKIGRFHRTNKRFRGSDNGRIHG